MNKYFCNNFKFFFYVFLIFNTRFFSIFFKFFNLETNFWAFFVQVYEVLSRFLSLSFHFNTAIIDNFCCFFLHKLSKKVISLFSSLMTINIIRFHIRLHRFYEMGFKIIFFHVHISPYWHWPFRSSFTTKNISRTGAHYLTHRLTVL